jgi:hypothetical protein
MTPEPSFRYKCPEHGGYRAHFYQCPYCISEAREKLRLLRDELCRDDSTYDRKLALRALDRITSLLCAGADGPPPDRPTLITIYGPFGGVEIEAL